MTVDAADVMNQLKESVKRMYKTRIELFAVNSALFDLNCANEVAVFDNCLATIRTIAIEPTRRIDNARIAALSEMVRFAYQLLLASWDNLRSGRMAAALDHARSVGQSSAYIRAAALSDDFAEKWLEDRTLTGPGFDDAIRAIRRAGRTADDLGIAPKQRYSHFDQEPARWTRFEHGGTDFQVPDGAYGPHIKLQAQVTALHALAILKEAAQALAVEDTIERATANAVFWDGLSRLGVSEGNDDQPN